MNKISAHFDYTQCKQKGFASPLILVVGVVVVVLVIIGIASGGLKGSFKVSMNNQATPQPAEEVSEENNRQETPTSTPTSVPSSNSIFKTFTSEEMGISFEYPETWNVNKGTDSVTISLMEEGKTNNAAAAISAIAKPLGNTKGFKFASIVDMQRVALKNEFNVSDFSVDKETKVGEKQAQLLEFNGSMSGNLLTGKYLTTADGNNIYAITVMSDSDKWSKYGGDLQKVLDSFKVLK